MVKFRKVLAVTMLLLASLYAAAQETKEATVIKEEMALWTLQDDGKMANSKNELNAGTTVQVYMKEDGRTPDEISAETSTSRSRGSTQTFTKISYEGNDYYVVPNMICIGGTPAVITTENACLYKTKNLADITSHVLVRSKVVCLKGTFKTVAGKEMSYVTYYDDSSSSQKSGYVKSEKTSTNRDDITALRALRKINATNNQKLKTDLVSTLRDLNVSGNVLELIGEAEMRILRATDLSLAGVMDIYPQKFTYLVEDDYLNIRDIPSKAGKTLGRLEFEDEFTAVRKTLATQTFDDVTDSWYYGVAKGIDGWIFGGYLTPIEEEVEDEEGLEAEGQEDGGESSGEGNSDGNESSETSGTESNNEE